MLVTGTVKISLICCLNLVLFLAGRGKTNVYLYFFFFIPVFLAPWIKGLIAVFVIGVIIAILVLGARCYVLKKAKGKYSSFILFW